MICFELYTYGKRKQVLWDTKFYLNQLFKDTKQIHIALYVSNWEVKPNECDMAYIYQLKNRNDSTLLKIEIDDFVQLLKMFKFIMRLP